MPASILVAYATLHGSTQEVAETVAGTLRDGGLAADCKLAKEVRSLEGYGGVVLGAPLYMFRWHKDAKRFLARHREALTRRPVAVLALGPFNDVPSEFQGAREQLDKELAKFPWLAPAAIEIFGGKFDPAALRFPYNLVPGLKRIPVSDIRDWAAIRAWAGGLPGKLPSAG
jgi:menaquinone-dependent protoporphyrinogen oxidase